MIFQASFKLFGKGRVFSLLRVRNSESFLHPSVPMETYCKQEVLCRYTLFALLLHVGLGSIPD